MARNYDRDYDREYQNYQGTLIQKKRRAMRNQARREALRKGLVHKGDNKDIDHIVPLVKGGGNNKANRRIKSQSENRSFRRTRSARMK